jgi:hypothetical protein
MYWNMGPKFDTRTSFGPYELSITNHTVVE